MISSIYWQETTHECFENLVARCSVRRQVLPDLGLGGWRRAPLEDAKESSIVGSFLGLWCSEHITLMVHTGRRDAGPGHRLQCVRISVLNTRCGRGTRCRNR
jgi:hypothetical protein